MTKIQDHIRGCVHTMMETTILDMMAKEGMAIVMAATMEDVMATTQEGMVITATATTTKLAEGISAKWNASSATSWDTMPTTAQRRRLMMEPNQILRRMQL
jgi:hypothetical protein